MLASISAHYGAKDGEETRQKHGQTKTARVNLHFISKLRLCVTLGVLLRSHIRNLLPDLHILGYTNRKRFYRSIASTYIVITSISQPSH